MVSFIPFVYENTCIYDHCILQTLYVVGSDEAERIFRILEIGRNDRKELVIHDSQVCEFRCYLACSHDAITRFAVIVLVSAMRSTV